MARATSAFLSRKRTMRARTLCRTSSAPSASGLSRRTARTDRAETRADRARPLAQHNVADLTAARQDADQARARTKDAAQAADRCVGRCCPPRPRSARISARSCARLNPSNAKGGGISTGGMRFSRAANCGGRRSMQRAAASSTCPRRKTAITRRSWARAWTPWRPWMVRAVRRRARPSAVRGPVLRPPCMRQRSLPRMAGARQGQPARVRATARR